MAYDYRELRGKIISKYGKIEAFAKAMKMSFKSMSLKLNGKSPWKQNEIITACELLEIPLTKMHIYFFAVKVQSA